MAQFAALNFGLLDVYANTSLGMPLYYRLAASLANVGGVLLYIGAVLGILGAASRNARLSAAALGYAALAGAVGAFARTDLAPPGIGLNPLLRSPWALPHPLAVLTGYALLVVAVVDPRLRDLYVKAAWTSLSLGLLLGAYWSYTTFGWGGYWEWDPVETGIFLTWLLALARIHWRSDGPLYAAAGAELLTMAITYGGVSPLHSFVGISDVSLGLAAASAALLALSVPSALRRTPEGLVQAGGALMYGAGLYIYATLLAPMAARAFGVQASVPSGNSAIGIYHAVLVPATAAVLVGIMWRWLGRRAALSWTAISIAAGAALGLAHPWSPASSAASNVAIYALVFLSAGALVASAAAARERGPLLAAVHASFAVLVAAIALSAPYAYHMSYSEFFEAKPGQTYLVKIGNEIAPFSLSVAGASGPRELVSIPPYLARYISGDIATAAGAAAALRSQLRFELVYLNGTPYVVAFGDLADGPHYVGGVPLYVYNVTSTPYGDLVVGLVDLGGAAVELPGPLNVLSGLLACPPNATTYNSYDIYLRVYVGRREATAVVKYDASGELKLIRGLVPGVALVRDWLDDYYVAVSPGGLAYDNAVFPYPLLQLAKYDLRSCLPLGAAALLSAYLGAPLNSTQIDSLLAANATADSYVVMVKKVPFVNLVWASGSALVALSALSLWRRRA